MLSQIIGLGEHLSSIPFKHRDLAFYGIDPKQSIKARMAGATHGDPQNDNRVIGLKGLVGRAHNML